MIRRNSTQGAKRAGKWTLQIGKLEMILVLDEIWSEAKEQTFDVWPPVHATIHIFLTKDKIS